MNLQVARRLASTLAALLVLLPALTLAEPSPQSASVQPEVWESLAGGDPVEVLVIMRGQADLRGAALRSSRASRGQYAYEQLLGVAQRTQEPLRTFLEAQGAEYRPFYVVNALWLKADADLIRGLAARPEVERIVSNPWVQGVPEPPEPLAEDGETRGVELNLVRVHADDVWALGHTGQGVVVAGQDTGYDWDHPALIEQYRGHAGSVTDHDYSWHDAIHENNPHTPAGNACGFDSPVPCDDHGHGTHTMGTMVGDDGLGHQIGMAPGAQWIGCRNMEEGWGTPATYLECFEFFLAPYPIGETPLQGDPARAPHVVNNSWSCPENEGCDAVAITLMEQAVANLRQAGIVVVVSAGNHGPSCETIINPPAIYPQSFTVAAFDHVGGGIAAFSSRGPVTYGGVTSIQPDIAAPGVNVYSSVPGGLYGTLSGTSMAAPHVAGGVALLLSAAPSYADDVESIESVLLQSAEGRTTSQGCGGDGLSDVPNNVWGWGILDVLGAVSDATAGTVQGTVREQSQGATLAEARVWGYLQGAPQVVFETQTDSTGNYSLDLPAASYELVAKATCYHRATVTGTVVISGTAIVQDFDLEAMPCTYLPVVRR